LERGPTKRERGVFGRGILSCRSGWEDGGNEETAGVVIAGNEV